MRAREFTINVPIKININGDDDPEISVDDQEEDGEENPRFVPPLQQNLELKKAALGKKSAVVNDLLDDDPLGEEAEDD